MIRLAMLLAMLSAAPLAGTRLGTPGFRPDCAAAGPRMVEDKGRAGFQRLDKLPPANEQLTVIHSVDGCQKPVIVRYGIGGNPDQVRH
jgi:hypothetical protein